MMGMLEYDFMRVALVMAVLIGLTAPAVGTFIVQRRLSLLGDGVGHIALTGIGLGLLTGTSPVLGALVVAVLGAVAIEVLRARSRSGADVALALLFYGGLAGGVLLTDAEGGGGTSLQSYLFGSISSVTVDDLYVVAALAAVVLGVVALFGRELFLLCQDEEVARASGLPVRFLSALVAVTAAVTVVIAMRAIGLLLVSALMVVPVAAAQQLTRGFRATMLLAMAAGVLSAVAGLAGSFEYDLPPGPSIVLLALTLFVAAVLGGTLVRRARARAAAGRRIPAVRSGVDAEAEVLGG
ncbi:MULTISPECIES: metal ABC transporter permease [Actinomadura]|uniref:Iron chelate uptake ABC transporter family permease subunit n=1 Tax=Actinomadura litoris TaxID=2678616 RepID=A0A7K1L6X9_9ACTN|nr:MULTISPECIES: metal ABC transporter permease [Actinomadura]MBT2209477.1 metal ABC transporter permease [Actinomadura sp. NEAU-AAG7]MUN40168.1 iron chelate uptake ABC transporter family permease subunit [Actinomadura litoris]